MVGSPTMVGPRAHLDCVTQAKNSRSLLSFESRYELQFCMHAKGGLDPTSHS